MPCGASRIVPAQLWTLCCILDEGGCGHTTGVHHLVPDVHSPSRCCAADDQCQATRTTCGGRCVDDLQRGHGVSTFRFTSVGHQVTSRPRVQAVQVLQEALQNIMSGVSQVSTDMITEAIFGLTKAMSAFELQPGKLFLWYDYFCCPQDPVLTLHCSGQTAGNPIESNQQRAISSIPAYISKCKFFMALYPVVESPDESQVFSQFTWAGRGWGYGITGLNFKHV